MPTKGRYLPFRESLAAVTVTSETMSNPEQAEQWEIVMGCIKTHSEISRTARRSLT